MKSIILGVTGSIAAYKAADLAHKLTQKGLSIHVIMTRSAQEFITATTFQSLTHNRVVTDMFELIDHPDIEHISLAKAADLVLIAPVSANIIGKIANGIADDMLSTVIMAVKNVPIVICPAMNTAMYENPIVQRNIKTLTDLDYRFIKPRSSHLACGDVGNGALADLETIMTEIMRLLES